jgi:N-acetylglutamate synthase-like GNAT family acetyltransferase
MSGTGSRTDFRPRDAAIHRPYPDEIPWELLLEADPDEARVRDYVDADLMRVAKHEGQAVGVYVVRPLTATRYELLNLAVASSHRRRGLGAWLLGHAIGLAETKGGREVLVRSTPLRGLFERTGFVREDGDLLLRLTPE